MSAPANGDPFAIMKDAAARTEIVISDLLQRHPMPWEYRDALTTEIAALRSARTLAESRAKLSEADLGGTTLTLALEEARLLRDVLACAADQYDRAGLSTAHEIRALRKRINGGIASNAARRCGLERAEEFRALRAAEACSGSDDGEEDAA